MPANAAAAKPELLTVREVAERVGVSRRTVYEWLRSGELAGRKFGGRWRVPASALDVAPVRRRQHAAAEN